MRQRTPLRSRGIDAACPSRSFYNLITGWGNDSRKYPVKDHFASLFGHYFQLDTRGFNRGILHYRSDGSLLAERDRFLANNNFAGDFDSNHRRVPPPAQEGEMTEVLASVAFQARLNLRGQRARYHPSE